MANRSAPPCCAPSRKSMLDFFLVLYWWHFLTWRTVVRFLVGPFFVKKKDGVNFRLVLDAQCTKLL